MDATTIAEAFTKLGVVGVEAPARVEAVTEAKQLREQYPYFGRYVSRSMYSSQKKQISVEYSKSSASDTTFEMKMSEDRIRRTVCFQVVCRDITSRPQETCQTCPPALHPHRSHCLRS